MSFDVSKFSFRPWNDFLGVVMQQGRVQLDSDWNDFVAQLTRRLQAGSLDTFGRAVVPRETPEGFLIASGARDELTIGAGRIYVDGLLAENHGQPHKKKWDWDTRLAELTGIDPVSFFKQPYLPFNTKDSPAEKLAAVFNSPKLGDGFHLIYVDVWQRDVTALQNPELIEKAVGVETTGRLQTVWQVKALENIREKATCDSEMKEWTQLIRPSGARLTTSTGSIDAESNPCLIPPAAGYQGRENQLYRVEIHRGSTTDANGKVLAATFKWSRDNATVASRVTGIPTLTQVVVEHVKRDDLLGFKGGDWIEILDDRHELHGKPGVLRRIQGGGVEEATRTLTLETALPPELFPVDSNGEPASGLNTRVRRWDQSGIVRQADGTKFLDLDSSGESSGIPIPPEGMKIILENGILVDFNLEKDLEFKTGDYWVFAARIADGSIEMLDKAPPRGIHHHYARLAIINLQKQGMNYPAASRGVSNAQTEKPLVASHGELNPTRLTDCRTLWPPANEGQSCDCTVCIHPDSHNDGTDTIQLAIDTIHRRGGGTVCLDVGTYRIADTLKIAGAKSIRIRGQGSGTVLLGGQAGPLFWIEDSVGVSIQNFAAIGSPISSQDGKKAIVNNNSAVFSIKNTVDFSLERVNAFCLAPPKTMSAAVALSGYLIGANIHDCAFAATHGVITVGDEKTYLLTAGLRMTDNFFMCQQIGISFKGSSFHYGNLQLSGNLLLGCDDVGIELTGGALKGSSIRVDNNTINLTKNGVGIRGGLDGLQVSENEISLLETLEQKPIVISGPASGIEIDGGVDQGQLNDIKIVGNRIRGLRGHGIVIRRPVGHGMIKSNVVENISGAGLVIEMDGSADYLAIENNHFLELAFENQQENKIYAAVLLLRVLRADVVGNVLNNVARSATQIGQCVGVLTFACGEVRVSGNRLHNIGPSQFGGVTCGIQCVAPFRHVLIDDNTVVNEGDASEKRPPWQALNINVLNRSFGGYVLESLHDKQILLVGPSSITTLKSEPGSASVHRNRFETSASGTSLVEIDAIETCLFTENLCKVTGAEGGKMPIGRIKGRHINASNNRLIGINSDQISLELKPEDGRFVVLGNLSTGAIMLTDKTENPNILPSPWLELNVIGP